MPTPKVKFTKAQMVDYIYHNFTRNGKKIPKSQLQANTVEELIKIIEKHNCEKQLRAWVNRPKTIKFMVDGEKYGKSLSWDCEAVSEEECRKIFEDEGCTNIKILPAKGNHRCGYCKSGTIGTDKNLLCEECREIFGHTFYSEL